MRVLIALDCSADATEEAARRAQTDRAVTDQVLTYAGAMNR